MEEIKLNEFEKTYKNNLLILNLFFIFFNFFPHIFLQNFLKSNIPLMFSLFFFLNLKIVMTLIIFFL